MEFIDSDVGGVREPSLIATKDRSGLLVRAVREPPLQTNSEWFCKTTLTG